MGLPVHFSLRNLFALVTLAAVICGSYWIAAPRWAIYQDQVQFEDSVRELKCSALIQDMCVLLGRQERATRGCSPDADGSPVAWIQFEWPNAIYFIYCPLERRAGGNPDYDLCTSVEVFRLSPVPRDYAPRSQRARAALPDRRLAYTREFFEFIAGDRQTNPGFQYDLIHEDPPRRSDLRDTGRW